MCWDQGWESAVCLAHEGPPHRPDMATRSQQAPGLNCDLADRLLDLGCDGIAVSEDWGTTTLFISPLCGEGTSSQVQDAFDQQERGKLVFFHMTVKSPIVGDLWRSVLTA